ncbi:MAG: T9SS type B sorting domain-containing protein [Pedobacter sp.]|nr:MAG: T9SS type B sorting domain-containing protein [Pedobacter sp.]
MKRFYKLFSLFVIFIFFQTEINAQVCTGALGDPVINIDFGRGSDQFGPPIAETTYAYQTATPNDGQYTIVKTTAGLNSGWHQNVLNHTPNDPNGYFMLVNANEVKNTFYEKTVQVCPNTTYEFGAWVINILRNSGIKPNIKFTIAYNSTSIDFFTNDIPEGGPTDWKKYTKVFTTPTDVTSVTLKMTNENPGGVGNDLGIDDITFRACGPEITSSINNEGIKADLCAGESKTYFLRANVSAGYANPVYQWQENNSGVWTNLSGETSTQTTVNFINATAGTYQYRLNVAERENIGSPLCGVSSSTMTIRVTEKPGAFATNDGPACFGGDIRLFTNNLTPQLGDVITYDWRGENFYSIERNPVIRNADLNNAGTYTLTVTVNGCSVISQTEVQVSPRIMVQTTFNEATICEGNSILLEASGGNVFKWTPSEGLSDPDIPNPVASPQKTTKYTVTSGLNDCTFTQDVIINVIPKTEGNAGADKRILAGQSVQLNGSATGSNISFSWSPTDYLDDPTILNPIATPPGDITYTLTINSDCNSITDDVFVRVFPKIEIPNTFTPNGDGINDTWIIPAIERFEKIKLEVLTRYGEKVFQANSFKSWDGKFKGKDLPVGTYFYTLYLGDTTQKFSGWILLTR